MNQQQNTQNPNNTIADLADKQMKTSQNSKKPKKNKKKEQTPQNVLFVIFFITALLFAFLVRANRARFEKDNPGRTYIENKVTIPTDKIKDYIDSVKTRIDEYLPETLPEF
jgi:cytoskeletal protein RodZ